MKHSILIAALLVLSNLAGCDRVEQIGAIMLDEQMTLVFPPGFEIAVDSKAVKVHGSDICPEENLAMNRWFGSSSNAGKAGCLVIRPATKSLQVRLDLASPVIEEWAVIRDAESPDKVSLRRPNGSLVVSYAGFAKLQAKT